MADSILTSGALQNADLYSAPARIVPTAAGLWVPICNKDVKRLALVVVPDNVGDTFQLSPIAFGSGSILSQPAPHTPVVIHASVYPLLIQGVWYIRSTGGYDFAVFDIIRWRGDV